MKVPLEDRLKLRFKEIFAVDALVTKNIDLYKGLITSLFLQLHQIF